MKEEQSKKFRTKRGRLTAYSFACGYKEQKSTDPSKLQEEDLYTELYHDTPTYHVRQYDRRPDAKKFRVLWESFETLTEARKFFDKQPGTLIRK